MRYWMLRYCPEKEPQHLVASSPLSPSPEKMASAFLHLPVMYQPLQSYIRSRLGEERIRGLLRQSESRASHERLAHRYRFVAPELENLLCLPRLRLQPTAKDDAGQSRILYPCPAAVVCPQSRGKFGPNRHGYPLLKCYHQEDHGSD